MAWNRPHLYVNMRILVSCPAQSVLHSRATNACLSCDLIDTQITAAFIHDLAHNDSKSGLLAVGVVLTDILGKFTRAAYDTFATA
ncbi:hypothetical protein FHT91_004896 [Rhizobium sp. BK347]|nr:hypothetical protein [Rhizobium sp. BK252]MBB3485102.1 hypothetical protein [Rhizobium sp. BK347]